MRSPATAIVIAAVPTPFTDEDAVDTASARRLLKPSSPGSDIVAELSGSVPPGTQILSGNDGLLADVVAGPRIPLGKAALASLRRIASERRRMAIDSATEDERRTIDKVLAEVGANR